MTYDDDILRENVPKPRRRRDRVVLTSAYLGIDPGKTGGIAVITESGYAGAWTMPDTLEGICEVLRAYAPPTFAVYAVVEKVGAYRIHGRTQGGKSMFTFGHNYGAVRGILTALQISFDDVHPTKWKRHFGLLKTEKRDALPVARELFPDVEFPTRQTMSSGKADALLLAEYARHTMEGI